MTKRDFFILLIKIFGLYSLIKSLLSTIPANMSFALNKINSISIIWILLVIVIVFGLFFLLVFKAASVVRFLKLDQGFDTNHIDFNHIKPAHIIQISCFIIGGLLIINNIPSFLSHALFSLKGLGTNPIQKFNWLVSGLNLVLGYVLVANFVWVSTLLSKRGSETPDLPE